MFSVSLSLCFGCNAAFLSHRANITPTPISVPHYFLFLTSSFLPGFFFLSGAGGLVESQVLVLMERDMEILTLSSRLRDFSGDHCFKRPNGFVGEQQGIFKDIEISRLLFEHQEAGSLGITQNPEPHFLPTSLPGLPGSCAHRRVIRSVSLSDHWQRLTTGAHEILRTLQSENQGSSQPAPWNQTGSSIHSCLCSVSQQPWCFFVLSFPDYWFLNILNSVPILQPNIVQFRGWGPTSNLLTLYNWVPIAYLRLA